MTKNQSTENNNELEEIDKEVVERFPLIETLELLNPQQNEVISVPHFLGIILSSAVSDVKEPICFVVPSKENIAFMVSAILALTETKNCFPEWLRSYAKTIHVGSLVNVIPHCGIFEYGGFYEDFPDRFKLILIGRTTGSRSLPIKDILRLETTDLDSPKGTMETFPESVGLIPLDDILGIQSFGNKSVFRGTTILLAVQRELDLFCRSIEVRGRSSLVHQLINCLVISTLDTDGDLKNNQPSADLASPMIAINNNAISISKAAKDATPFTRTVLVDGASVLGRNLQAFDKISKRQKLIIVAEPSEVEAITDLHERGCTVWELERAELLLGETPRGSENNQRKYLFESSMSKSEQELDAISVTSTELMQIHFDLKSIDMLHGEDENNQVLEPIIATMNIIFVRLFAVCWPDFNDPACVEKIERVAAQIERDKKFIAPSTYEKLCLILEDFKSVIELFNASYNEKYLWLAQYLKNVKPDERVGIAVGHRDSAAALERWVSTEHFSAECLTHSQLTNEQEFDILILIGWPGHVKWKKLQAFNNFKRLIFVGYEFELCWLAHWQQKNLKVFDKFVLSGREKQIQLSTECSFRANKKLQFLRRYIPITSPPDNSYLSINASINSERKDGGYETTELDCKQARYISFAGDFYAYLTSSCLLPVLYNGLTYGEGRIKSITGDDIEVGNILLFREHGEQNIIQTFAKQIAGEHEYANLRIRAGKWRVPFQKVDQDVRHIDRLLTEAGLIRTQQTIRLWLNDPDLIGPTRANDIYKIGTAFKDEYLLKHYKAVASAISEIRSLHIQAGRLLTDTILTQVSERKPNEETLLTLSFGKAYLVEVESIEDEYRPYPASKTNKLRMRFH